jgi:hypothetical protein
MLLFEIQQETLTKRHGDEDPLLRVRTTLWLLVVFFFGLGPLWAAPFASLYVATNGNDAWSGSQPSPNQSQTDGPFATLEAARDAIRRMKNTNAPPEGGVMVWIRNGTYTRATTFELTAKDSGSATGPITWRAYEKEQVRLLGGKSLHGFQPVTDPSILSRLSAEARAHVLQCDLRAHGITNFGRLTRRGFECGSHPAHLELFFGGQRMTLARWPNESDTTIAGTVGTVAEGDRHGGELGKLEEGFHYQGDRPKNWKSFDDIWVHGYWAWDWADTYEEIASIDTKQRLIKTKPPYGVYGYRKGQRFYFLNVLEELDSPGEYFVAHDTGLIYFWPPEPIEKRETTVSVLEDPLVRLQDATNIDLIGLTLESARGVGVEIKRGASNTVAGCSLRDLGNYAVIISGGEHNRLAGCDLASTGDGGVILNGGNRATLFPAGNAVENCHIEHFGEWSRCYQPAVMINGVGNVIAHCLIHDGPHNAIQLGGNEHVIEFNDISRVCLESGDVGAFYMGRDWTQRGNVIRFNCFHDLHKVGGLQAKLYPEVMAVYLDDCTSGTTVFGNIFYKAGRGTFVGGGRDNTIENNIYVDCDPAVAVDGRGLDNAPVWRDMVFKTMRARLVAMKPHKSPYLDKYPQLLELDNYYVGEKGIPPEGNKITRNICVGKWLNLYWHAKPEMMEIQDNLVQGDPGFVGLAKPNFQLKPDSPAFKLGFQRIPEEKIGLIQDEYRALLAH